MELASVLETFSGHLQFLFFAVLVGRSGRDQRLRWRSQWWRPEVGISSPRACQAPFCIEWWNRVRVRQFGIGPWFFCGDGPVFPVVCGLCIKWTFFLLGTRWSDPSPRLWRRLPVGMANNSSHGLWADARRRRWHKIFLIYQPGWVWLPGPLECRRCPWRHLWSGRIGDLVLERPWQVPKWAVFEGLWRLPWRLLVKAHLWIRNPSGWVWMWVCCNDREVLDVGPEKVTEAHEWPDGFVSIGLFLQFFDLRLFLNFSR